jgi:hypothetical protein
MSRFKTHMLSTPRWAHKSKISTDSNGDGRNPKPFVQSVYILGLVLASERASFIHVSLGEADAPAWTQGPQSCGPGDLELWSED